MGNQQTIVLNGKRYDARTGKVISTDPLPDTTRSKTKKPSTPKVKSIDGFARASQAQITMPKRQTNQAAVHKAEKSKTLMRKTVAKPKADVVKPRTMEPQPITRNTTNIDQQRLAHAQSVPKSTAISRFSSNEIGTVSSTQANSPVANKKSVLPTADTEKVHQTTTKKASFTEKALAHAEATEATRPKRDKRSVRVARKLHLTPRQVSFSSFAIAFLLIGGFFLYQNTTNIGMRIASSRAGIRGNLPGYQPAGFSVSGGIAYNPGQITIPYKSNSDDRNFKIVQNVSEWNSQALMDNYVAINHPSNQTIQDRGKTIYIYNGSNATWVDGGIWYRIEGDSQLNSDQLLNIAASL